MAELVIYTDGACRGNPGKGGYGIVLQFGDTLKKVSQGFKYTTNNRMELMAVIVALQMLTRDGLDIKIYTDSSYVVNSIEKKWVWGWVKTGFKGKKNADLWRKFLEYCPKNNIKMIWVKGHADNVYNNMCDQLATAAADGNNLIDDLGFQKGE